MHPTRYTSIWSKVGPSIWSKVGASIIAPSWPINLFPNIPRLSLKEASSRRGVLNHTSVVGKYPKKYMKQIDHSSYHQFVLGWKFIQLNIVSEPDPHSTQNWSINLCLNISRQPSSRQNVVDTKRSTSRIGRDPKNIYKIDESLFLLPIGFRL